MTMMRRQMSELDVDGDVGVAFDRGRRSLSEVN